MSCMYKWEHRITQKTSYYVGRTYKVSCRRCAGCRATRKNDLLTTFTWELISAYKKKQSACFVTLTYDNTHLPIVVGLKNYDKLTKNKENVKLQLNATLRKTDFQLFNKRVRRRIEYANKKFGKELPNYKFLAAGEYGDKKGRPHFHMIVFGYTAKDFKTISRGAWNNGTMEIEPLKGINGIGYLLDYIDNSIPRKVQEEQWRSKGFEPPFVCHSQRIGQDYFEHYISDFIENGLLVRHKDRFIPLPKNFRNQLRAIYGFKFENFFDKGTRAAQDKANMNKYGFTSFADYDYMRNYASNLCLIDNFRQKGHSMPIVSFPAINSHYKLVNNLALEASEEF